MLGVFWGYREIGEVACMPCFFVLCFRSKATSDLEKEASRMGAAGCIEAVSRLERSIRFDHSVVFYIMEQVSFSYLSTRLT